MAISKILHMLSLIHIFIKAEIEDFVDKVYNSIREFGYNLKTTPTVSYTHLDVYKRQE